jgi:S-adenosylmethionine hydrolase
VITPSGLITLLTDFGLHDPFVGVMKGVILARFEEARIVDLCHAIAPQDIVQGAFWLERSYGWFPTGTVHVAVVDPGVGSDRAALAVRSCGHIFVGPDNGLFGGLIASDSSAEVRAIDLGRLGLPPPSATFHGRDVFAPAAAEIAAWKLAFADVGPEHPAAVGPVVPVPSKRGDRIDGCVVSVDRFGNLITNVDAALLVGISSPIVGVAGIERPLVRTYSDGSPGDYLALVGSFGTVELAMRDGNASLALGAKSRDPAYVRAGA